MPITYLDQNNHDFVCKLDYWKSIKWSTKKSNMNWFYSDFDMNPHKINLEINVDWIG